jgi:phosphoglycerate dehydrogenase-like enzyme
MVFALERKTVLFKPRKPVVPWNFLHDIGSIHFWDTPESNDHDHYTRMLERIQPHAVVGSIPPFTSDMMDLNTQLEWIFTFSQGFNQIDVEAATDRGIMVSNCGGTPETGHGVAELAWAHILAVLRRIPLTDSKMRTGELMNVDRWGGSKTDDDLHYYRGGYMLWGKTLGLIGLGMAGSRMALTGRLGFNMRVIVYDPYIPRKRAELLSVELVDLHTVFKEADVISIHAPLNDETRGLVGDQELRLMKKTAIIVNDARGPIIDMPALAKVLEEERIYGAGIDVWQEEPPDPQAWWVKSLQTSSRTCLTHHIGNVYETLIARHHDAMQNIQRFCNGQTPLWVVNPQVIWKKQLNGSQPQLR